MEEINNHTIYVPSKGRYDVTNKTINLLNKHSANYFVVVEREEESLYLNLTSRIIVLPESNKGLSYSRSWIKSYSKGIGEKYHWQMDDDITSFCQREYKGKQCIVSPIFAIREVESIVSNYNNVAIAGFNFNAFPPGKNPIKINKPVYRCTLIKNDNDVYWGDFVPIEDVEYSASILMGGYATLLFDHLRVNSPAPGKLKGGLKEIYELSDVVSSAHKRVCKKWVSLGMSIKDGRVDTGSFFKKITNKLSI
jgi:hypothetical protein